MRRQALSYLYLYLYGVVWLLSCVSFSVTPMDCSTLGLPVPRYLLIYIYIYIHKLLLYLCERVSHSVVSDSVTSGTIALQAPLSMGLSRQEY